MRIPPCVGGSTPHQGGRHLPILPAGIEVTYLLHPPGLVLLTIPQFCKWLRWSQGSPSDCIYRQWCHSLSQMHVFLLMSAAMSHYLWSTPIFCGCSGGGHGRSCNFPLIHPREVLLAGHWVTTLPMSSCGGFSISPPVEVGLHGVGLVHLSHAWQTPIHKGMPTSAAMRRSQFRWRMCDLLCWSITS